LPEVGTVKTHQVAGRIFARKLKQHGIDEINPAQGRLMFVLWREDGISINELAKRTSLKKSTLTSMLDRLEATGHLKRVPSRTDRRQVLIRRTAKDIALENVYVEASQDMTKLFYKGFTVADVSRFEEDLHRILENLTDFETNLQ
jgi:DNA-binding MarR family transcriptional regulator